MTVLRKSVELGMPMGEAEARWADFERSRAELAGSAEVGFEHVEGNRTRVTIAGESASIEGTADEFRKFVENGAAREGRREPATR